MFEASRPAVSWRAVACAAACAAALLAAPNAPLAAISIPVNTWVKQPAPSITTLPNFPGTFQARGWNHLLYDTVGKRMILYDGYMDATRPYSIYANALWTYDPTLNRMSLEKVSNWTRAGEYTVPLASNVTDPTPWDRHSYSSITYVPEVNRLYMWSGANSSIANGYIGDTWTYDFATKRWREIVTASHPWNVLEQTMTYDPNVRRLVLYGGGESSYQSGEQAWLFNIDTEIWELASTPSAPPARMSQSMVFDPVRRVSWVFGGGPYPDAGNELWSFDASARTWQRITASGAVPPVRRFGAMAYDSRHDIVLLWGGIISSSSGYNDTWVFTPTTRTWQQITASGSPAAPIANSEDLAYDPDNDVFVLHQNGEFWFFRYAPTGSDAVPPGVVRDLRTR
jgi:hypothetical protein